MRFTLLQKSMRAIAIADDDSLIGQLVPESVDLLLCLGDLWDGSIEKAHARYTPRKAFGIKGNHDSDINH
jgi:predicted phosphodiesterase